ncbi:MAG: Rpn family recombination-promoting nuclease/putative transposase [Treponema sp.]|nr:Rpn family recombination-promoting nuclease/putative transposase [Treponema sp.]
MKRKLTKEQLEKEFSELGFTNDFLFTQLMKDEKLCRALIERLLKIKISHVLEHKTQKYFRHKRESHGVRFDVYLKESSRVFDVELQVENFSNFPLRARYYQSIMDIETLPKNRDYSELPESYVLFICTKDPFGGKLPIYSIDSTIRENRQIPYNDKTLKIFYNAAAWKRCEDPEIKSFLEFITTKSSSSDFTKNIEESISRIKNDQGVKQMFMTKRQKLSIDLEEEYGNGLAEGRIEGRQEAESRLQPIIDQQSDQINKQSDQINKQSDQIKSQQNEINKLKEFITSKGIQMPE